MQRVCEYVTWREKCCVYMYAIVFLIFIYNLYVYIYIMYNIIFVYLMYNTYKSMICNRGWSYVFLSYISHHRSLPGLHLGFGPSFTARRVVVSNVSHIMNIYTYIYIYGCQPKNMGLNPQIIHLFIGFLLFSPSILGGFRLFLETPIYIIYKVV